MAVKRVPITTVSEPKHTSMMLEGRAEETLPANRVYVDADTGEVKDGRRGGRLRDLDGDEVEIPRTVWF